MVKLNDIIYKGFIGGGGGGIKFILVVCLYLMWRGIMFFVMLRINIFWGLFLVSLLIDVLLKDI